MNDHKSRRHAIQINEQAAVRTAQDAPWICVTGAKQDTSFSSPLKKILLIVPICDIDCILKNKQALCSGTVSFSAMTGSQLFG